MHIATGNTSITLWIDAICINQTNPTEKATQVDQMRAVYSQAERVVVWLGGGTHASAAAFRFMNSKRGVSWPEGWNALAASNKQSLRGIEGVFWLLERPWFRRLWVIQEVALAAEVLVVCGDDRIGFGGFEACVYAVWKFYEGIVDYGEDDEALLGLWGVTRLLQLRDDFRSDGEVSWERLLQAASQRLATDSRDKVFAFRGLAEGGRPLPSTDYGVGVCPEEVYMDTAVALLCHGECLDLLPLAGKARNGDSSLPSWVPDHREFTWSEPLAMADGMSWNAGGPFASSPAVVSLFGLELLVKPVGRVARTLPVFTSWDVLHQQVVIRDLVGLRTSFRLPLSERDWLNLLAMSLIYGLDIDDQPAQEEEYRQYFDEWYQWLMSSTSQSDLPRIKHNKFYRVIVPRLDGWKAFVSEKGFFGIGPPDVEVGDALCVAPGCRLPLVLRPVAAASNGTLSSDADMHLISWCYMQGMMDGEAAAEEYVLSRVCLR